jgi:hypothetical protein
MKSKYFTRKVIKHRKKEEQLSKTRKNIYGGGQMDYWQSDTQLNDTVRRNITKGVDRRVESVKHAVTNPLTTIANGGIGLANAGYSAVGAVGKGANAVGHAGSSVLSAVGKGANAVGNAGSSVFGAVGKGATSLARGVGSIASGVGSIASQGLNQLAKKGNNMEPRQRQQSFPMMMGGPSSGQIRVQDKPTTGDIITLLKTVFHESWFQDQFLDILSKNIKTQYFNKILEVTLFNIFNNILDNITKNDNIIVAISILKNNIKYFEELIKQAITEDRKFEDNYRVYPSNDNVLRTFTLSSTEYSRAITNNFRNLLLPESSTLSAQAQNNEQSVEFESIRAKYLVDLEKEKTKLEEEEANNKKKKITDREASYKRMIEENIQAQATIINENDIKTIMDFFNNVEESTNTEYGDANEGAIIINGERYNEMIIRTICDCIKDMLEKEDSTKEIIRIVLNRFDYMLKEFIDIMQNNGIIKIILLRIFDNHPFIFVAFHKGIETAINKKIESISKTRALNEAFIVRGDIQGDYAFFKLVISSIIDELTGKLQLFIPSEENPDDSSNTLTGGNNQTTRKKQLKHHKITHHKTIKKSQKGGRSCGWFW